ncbi:MAG: DUF2064 domain-containing protein [Bacillota bacterium]
MKHALLVFTKVPKAGEVKTRLTEDRGGILTPEEANGFYESCVLDVIDTCLTVEGVDVWVCYNKDGNRADLDGLLQGVKGSEKIVGVFPDAGGSFDDCMQYATDYILKNGAEDRLADAVTILGGDLPSLQRKTIEEAISKLDRLSKLSATGAALVQGACQEGGFSLVGLTTSTPFDFHKVFYNMDGITALDMLVNKVVEENIPFGTVEMMPDVDIPVDLASILPLLRALEAAQKNDPSVTVPRRTMEKFKEIGLETFAFPPHRDEIG